VRCEALQHHKVESGSRVSTRAAHVKVQIATLLLVLSASAVLRADELVPPRLLEESEVVYPEGSEGIHTVTLAVIVDRAGQITEVIATPGEEPFASLATSAAKRFVFAPATRDRVAIAARIKLVIVFWPPKPPPKSTEAPPSSIPHVSPGPQSPVVPLPAPEEVRVRGLRGEPSRTASLTRAEVRQIPGTFGDPFRAVEIMPGVTPTVSGIPYFYVRGAPPGNVGYFLDNIRVPYLFHVGAGPSVVHPGLVDRVDLYSGGYPARYGRFTGGIVSGETLEPSEKARGEFNLRALDAGALAETPFANGKGHILLGGRYSYTAAALSLLSPRVLLDYWDYQARLNYDLGKKDRLSVFTFGAYDYLAQKTAADPVVVFGTEFHRVSLRHDHTLGRDGNLRTEVILGIDRTRLGNDRFLRDRLLTTRTEFTQRMSDALLVRAGADMQFDRYDIELNQGDLNAANASIASAFPSRSDLNLGVRGDAVWRVSKNFEITPGVRFDFFSSQGVAALAVDPRLQTRTQLSARVALLSAIGIAHQPPSFIIPVPGFQPGGLKGGLQRTLQESFGAEFDLGKSLTLTTTVFHNAFFNLSDALSVDEPQVQGCVPGSFPAGSLAGDPGRQPTGNGGSCSPRFPKGPTVPAADGKRQRRKTIDRMRGFLKHARVALPMASNSFSRKD
jgi:TonB-dependent Receptor Plug Domain